MFNYNGKEYRNLVEQVLKNKNDIDKIIQSSELINDYGLKIVGTVPTEEQLPDPETYTGSYGDCYIVGELDNYAIYIFTRPFESEQYPSWFNLGNFPSPGPEGPTGPQGPIGETGERGSKWSSGNTNPSVVSTDKAGDMYLNTSNSDIFEFDGSAWNRVGNIKGAQGIQGIQGPRGKQGIQGPTGPQGEPGEQGKSFVIKGILASSDLLPTPSSIPDNEAYLVGANEDYDLYVQVNDAWVNVGKVTTVEGPTGPQGPEGVQGPSGDSNIYNGRLILNTGTQPDSDEYYPLILRNADSGSLVDSKKILSIQTEVEFEYQGNMYLLNFNQILGTELPGNDYQFGIFSIQKITLVSESPLQFTLEVIPVYLEAKFNPYKGIKIIEANSGSNLVSRFRNGMTINCLYKLS